MTAIRWQGMCRAEETIRDQSAFDCSLITERLKIKISQSKGNQKLMSSN